MVTLKQSVLPTSLFVIFEDTCKNKLPPARYYRPEVNIRWALTPGLTLSSGMDKKEMNKKKYRVKQQRAVSGAVC